jgi:hypothetical protein
MSGFRRAPLGNARPVTQPPIGVHGIFDGSPAAPSKARQLIRDAIPDAAELAVASAQLLVSELVSSAVRHGSRRIAVAVLPVRDVVRIEVVEQAVELESAPGVALEEDDRDRLGAQVVDALADRHGRDMRSDGMATWVELDVTRPTGW